MMSSDCSSSSLLAIISTSTVVPISVRAASTVVSVVLSSLAEAALALRCSFLFCSASHFVFLSSSNAAHSASDHCLSNSHGSSREHVLQKIHMGCPSFFSFGKNRWHPSHARKSFFFSDMAASAWWGESKEIEKITLERSPSDLLRDTRAETGDTV
jgi:hypothetical protein